MYKITQSKFLANQLDSLLKPGINVVSCSNGIIIAGKTIGIFLRREAKNRVHVLALCAGDAVPSKEWDFQNMSDAIQHCSILVDLDNKLHVK